MPKSTLQKYNILITDVDGTIVDRMPIYAEVFVCLLSKFGMSKDFLLELYLNSSGSFINNQIAAAFAKKGFFISNEAVKDLAEEFFLMVDVYNAPLFEGASKTLLSLAAKGVLLFATSGSRTKELKSLLLEKNKLPYAAVMGSDSIPKGLDHIIFFADFLKMDMREFCRRAVMVGDGPRDMEIAKECEIYAVGIPNTVTQDKLIAAGANEIIPSIECVMSFFKS